MDTLVSNLMKLPRAVGRPLVIAISGYGGSGKTTLASELQAQLTDARVVSIDSFADGKPWYRSADWDNFDRTRFTKQVLRPSANNAFPLTYDQTMWPGQSVVGPIIVPRCAYLIVEGCSIFHPSLLDYYDYKIWADCPLDLATERGMWRDRHVNNDEQDNHWQNIWMPNDEDFMEKYRPDLSADIRIDTSHS